MKYLSNIDLAGVSRILNSATPVADTDLVTKGYVVSEIQKAIAGFDFQADVKAIQTDATTVAGTPVTGDRYIITNTSTLDASFGVIAGIGNGDIIEYNGSAFEISYDVSVKGDGVLVFVSAAEQYYKYVAATWSYGGMSAVSAGTGIQDTSGTFSVKLDNVTVGLDGNGKIYILDDAITKAKIAADVAGQGLAQDTDGSLKIKLNDARLAVDASGLKLVETYNKKFASNVGDGTATTIAVTHGLNTKDVTINVYAIADGSTVAVDTKRTDVNTVTLVFVSAPTVDQYRVVVEG
jgi:hypothetical protein